MRRHPGQGRNSCRLGRAKLYPGQAFCPGRAELCPDQAAMGKTQLYEVNGWLIQKYRWIQGRSSIKSE